MPRSGNHAFINWLCLQSDKTILHRNDIQSGNRPTYTKKYGKGEHLLILNSYEAQDIRQVFRFPLPNFLLLRDPYNWMASHIKSFLSKNNMENLVERYITYFQEYPELTYRTVFYHLWHTSFEYRMKILDNLNFPQTDNGKDIVPNIAKGSSFDGVKYEGRASEMQVFTRYERLIGTLLFDKMCGQYPELMMIHDNYFSEVPLSTSFRERVLNG